MANEQLNAFDFGMQDPNDMQDQQDQQYQQEITSPRATAVSSGMASMAQGMYNATGGSPQVKRQQAMQSAMSDILSGVNQQTSDSTDPIDKQMMIAQRVQQRFADIDPHIAMSANDRLIQLQQAKAQQSALNLKQREAQQELDISTLENASLNVAGLDPKTGEYKVYGSVDASDPEAAQKLAKLKTQAQAEGVTAGIMSDKSLTDSKTSVAFAKLQAQTQQAQIRAAAMTQAALIRAQSSGQKMAGNQAVMANRMFSASMLGSTAAVNIMEMPIGSTGGVFGIGSAPGPSIMKAGQDTLRNKLTDEQTKDYLISTAGMWRNLGMLEQQGGLQGGQHFADQIKDVLQLREGDTGENVMRKMAEVRQILEVAPKAYLANTKLDPALRDTVEQSLQAMRDAIPFTVHDVNEFQKMQQKNPKLTMEEYASKIGLGSSGPASTTPKAMPSAAKLTAYAKAHFGGDEAKAKTFLTSQGYQ